MGWIVSVNRKHYFVIVMGLCKDRLFFLTPSRVHTIRFRFKHCEPVMRRTALTNDVEQRPLHVSTSNKLQRLTEVVRTSRRSGSNKKSYARTKGIVLTSLDRLRVTLFKRSGTYNLTCVEKLTSLVRTRFRFIFYLPPLTHVAKQRSAALNDRHPNCFYRR